MPERAPRPLLGDWALIAHFCGEGEAWVSELQAELDWPRRKANSVVAAMIEAQLVRRKGGKYWLTHRGLAAWRAPR